MVRHRRSAHGPSGALCIGSKLHTPRFKLHCRAGAPLHAGKCFNIMSADATFKPIIAWCHPRSCSTAFERAFLQREDTHTFHEPLGDPFYFGKDRPCHRYSEEECQKSDGYNKTAESVAISLLESSKEPRETECRYIFIKVRLALITGYGAVHFLAGDPA